VFAGKTYPTYFHFRGLRAHESLERDANLGSRTRVSFETDANDDYFIRDLDPGQCSLNLIDAHGASPQSNWSLHGPQSGVAKLSLELPSSASVGSTLSFEIRVTDPSRIDPFVNALKLHVRPAVQHSSGGTGSARSTTGGVGKHGGGATLSLPNIVKVHEAEWPDHKFTEASALEIKNA